MDFKKNTNVYWNSQSTINEFSSLQVPEYWRDFFAGNTVSGSCKVLDLGCGGGRNTYMLISYGFDTYACDLHSGMVEATRVKVSQLIGYDEAALRIIQADMLKLPYDSSNFDIVLANGIYHNTSSVEEFETAVTETARVLKAGGLLCFNVFTEEFVDSNLVKQKLPHLYLTPDNLNMILLPIKKIKKIFIEKGFSINEDLSNYISKVQTGKRSVLRGIIKKMG